MDEIHGRKGDSQETGSGVHGITQSYGERRSDFRFPIVMPVDYFRADHSGVSSYTLDLSNGGAFISADDPLEKGSLCGIRLTVPVGPESSRVFKTGGTIIWSKILLFKSKRNGMGVQFLEPLPDNIFLNALGDTARKVTREIEARKSLEEKLEHLQWELEEAKRLTALGSFAEKILFEVTNPILTLSETLELFREKLHTPQRRLEEHPEKHRKELIDGAGMLAECCTTIDWIVKKYQVISDLAHIAGYSGEKLEKHLQQRLTF